jgi:hypothetical protein
MHAHAPSLRCNCGEDILSVHEFSN